MKRTIKLLALAAIVAVFGVPTLAQSKECNDENKGAWYKTFYDNFRGTAEQQKTAVEAAKTYLGACPANPEDKQAEYMKKFVDKYDALMGKADLAKQFDAAIASKNYGEQMRVGKQLLATDPDNLDVSAVLGVAGLGDAKLLSESAPYAKKTIELINAGKALKAYSRDQALAYSNWTVGKSKLVTAPADAISDLLKAARIESEVKKNPQIYIDLAAGYETGPRATYSEQYTASLNPDKTETAQSKVILENLNRVIDNQIDAMARAAALTTDAGKKQAIVTDLTALYKYRNKSETGVTDLVANVLNKPIPDVPTPVTSVPSTSGSMTPGTNNAGASNGTGNGAGTGATNNGGASNPSSAKPATTTTTSTTSAGSPKPSASPTPMTKKPR